MVQLLPPRHRPAAGTLLEFPTMMKITIPRNALRALVNLAARDDIRSYLNGIMIEAHPSGRAILVATNGHVLGAIHCPDAVEGLPIERGAVQIIVPVEIVRALKRSAKLPRAGVEITGAAPAVAEPGGDYVAPAAMMLRDPCNSIALEFTPIEGRFPEFRRVVPAASSGSEVGFYDPRYVSAFEAAAQELTPSRMVQSFVHQAGTNPALVTMPAAPEFIGVIMPMRVDQSAATAPDWIRAQADTPADLKAAA